MTGLFRQSLVSAKWLYSAIQSSSAIRVHISEGCTELSAASAPYVLSHIANASYTNLHDISNQNSNFSFMVPSAQQFAEHASSRGIKNDDHVVLYGRSEEMAFNVPLARIWFLFKLFGHEKVSILDGGFKSWTDNKFPVSSEAPTFERSNYVAKLNESLLADFKRISSNAKLPKSEFQLVDVRPTSLHEAGSVNHAKSVPHMNFFNEDGSFKDEEGIKEVLKSFSVDLDSKEQPVVAMCQRGVSACVLPFAASILGKNDIAVYDGSWQEYSALSADEGSQKKPL